jgi:hypothetical protein
MFSLFITGTQGLDGLPKSRGMIGMFKVSHLVTDQIVDYIKRCHGNAPIIVDVAQTRATSPTGFGVFDSYAAYFAVEAFGGSDGLFAQGFEGFLFKKIRDTAM